MMFIEITIDTLLFMIIVIIKYIMIMLVLTFVYDDYANVHNIYNHHLDNNYLLTYYVDNDDENHQLQSLWIMIIMIQIIMIMMRIITMLFTNTYLRSSRGTLFCELLGQHLANSSAHP